MSEQSDKELILATQAGDEQAFKIIVARHHISIRSYLVARTQNPHDAEDLAQDAFVTAYRKISTFAPDRSIRPWLRGIAHKLLANYRRKYRPDYIGGNEELDGLLSEKIDQSWERRSGDELHEDLQACIQKLGKEAQSLIAKRYQGQKSMAELCRSLGRKRSALSMQLHRIRLALKLCLEKGAEG